MTKVFALAGQVWAALLKYSISIAILLQTLVIAIGLYAFVDVTFRYEIRNTAHGIKAFFFRPKPQPYYYNGRYYP